jgi:hypothetical protein
MLAVFLALVALVVVYRVTASRYCLKAGTSWLRLELEPGDRPVATMDAPRTGTLPPKPK